MKKILSLLLVLAMLLSACPALAETIYFDLDQAGAYVRRCDDALYSSYSLLIAEGAVADMTDDQLNAYFIDCTGNCMRYSRNIKKVTENGIPCRKVTYKMTYRPSNAILKAYQSGSTASLSQEEKQVLKIAKDIVTKAKQAGQTVFARELYIHDELVDLITYRSHDGLSGDQLDRVHNCIGALVDRQANCQGYADAFYLLCSMLGMEVKIMNNKFTDSRAHTWNAVNVSGRWVMVDVTYDDTNAVFDEKKPHYACFNFAADMADPNQVWDKGMEPAPIARSSGSEYFYFQGEQPHGAAFSDLASLARYAYQQRSKSKNNKYIYAVLLGHTIDDLNDVHKAIKTAVKSHKRKTSWYVNYQNRGNHCFITIRWDKF